MPRKRSLRRSITTLVLLAASVVAPHLASASPAAATATAMEYSHAGRWLTDAAGRVVITSGVNMVYKRAPYTQEAIGFGDDDAAFLADNGFDSVRVGLIWKAIEPAPGRYDDSYLASIRRTVEMLASHGIASLIDMHQDMYNERFQGEFAPDWAVLDDGIPAQPQLGFPGNMFSQPALARAYDHFLANAPGPGGIGLQDRFAAAGRMPLRTSPTRRGCSDTTCSTSRGRDRAIRNALPPQGAATTSSPRCTAGSRLR